MPLVFEKQTVWTRAMPITRLSARIDAGCATSTRFSARSEFARTTVLAELERSLIIENRTQAGMKEARRRGVKFGRKPKLSPAQVAKARKLIEHGERVEAVAELWNVGRSTLYRELAG